MKNIIVAAIVIIVVGVACFYIWKEKKSGKCVGCPSASCGSCHSCGDGVKDLEELLKDLDNLK